MNRLELVQRLAQEAGVSGSPTTTVDQTGEFKRLVDWIDAAWEEIQGLHTDWSFLWEQTTVTVPAGASFVAQSIPASRYIADATWLGSSPMAYLPWRDFSLRYPVITSASPQAWTIRPDKAFAVNAVVAADSVFTVQRYKSPVAMAANADVPALDAEHHLTIMWRALMLYFAFDEAGAGYRLAKINFDRGLARMESTCLPGMTLGEPLLCE